MKANYTVDAEHALLTGKQISSTVKLCSEPYLEAESYFSPSLAEGITYIFTDPETLVLTSKKKDVEFVLKRVQ